MHASKDAFSSGWEVAYCWCSWLVRDSALRSSRSRLTLQYPSDLGPRAIGRDPARWFLDWNCSITQGRCTYYRRVDFRVLSHNSVHHEALRLYVCQSKCKSRNHAPRHMTSADWQQKNTVLFHWTCISLKRSWNASALFWDLKKKNMSTSKINLED